MIKITSVQKSKSTFYRVYFDNKESLRVSEDMLVNYRLLKDREFSEKEFYEIKKKIGYDIGLQLAMNYISYQLRSEKEVRTYLKGKEIDPADCDLVVSRLKELQVLDDSNYAKSYIRTQLRLNDKGPQVLKRDLVTKGIAMEKIAEALELYTPELQTELAEHAAQKVIKKTHGKSHRELLDKIRQNLLQKGFSSDVIRNTMEQLDLKIDEDAEWEALCKEGRKQLRRLNHKTSQQKRTTIKQKLYQKGFSFDLIQRFIDEEVNNEK